MIAIALTVAIDSIKGLNLFNVFQSVLGFIAPPMTAVFLLGVFWRRTTTRAANLALTAGTAFCLIVGILYLWGPKSDLWPHFMMLSFLLFVVLAVMMVIVSLASREHKEYDIPKPVAEPASRLAMTLWIALFAVMIALYFIFN